jgi:hypothetical protein
MLLQSQAAAVQTAGLMNAVPQFGQVPTALYFTFALGKFPKCLPFKS